MKCGKCLIDFKSYLKLQLHKAQEHGEKNQMSGYTSVNQFQGGSATRKEKEALLDERLHREIEKLKSRR